jgi:hypothetical protein
MNWQLSLFKGPRQRGDALASPKEFDVHVALADFLRRWTLPGWHWTHIPLGEYRNPITASRLKRMGVQPGWPDFIFIGPGRAVFFLELKRRGHGQTPEQARIAAHLIDCGCTYLCTDDIEDALATLRELGIVRARVSA